MFGKIPYYRQRWVSKPGATGWAQVNLGCKRRLGITGKKLSYDLFYIKIILAARSVDSRADGQIVFSLDEVGDECPTPRDC